MSWFGLIYKIRDFFDIGDDTTPTDRGRSRLTPAKVQKAIEVAIANGGVKLMYSKSLVFGNLMIIHLSSEANDVLRPVEKTALNEIEKHLPDKLRRQGWELSQDRLRIQLVPDPSLSGLKMRVVASDADITRMRDTVRQPVPSATAPTVRMHQKNSRNEWTLPQGREALVGRAGTGIEIGLRDDSVSRVHASLVIQNGTDGKPQGVLVKDIESSYGTYVSGTKVPPHGTLLARHGDTIRFGGMDARITIGDSHLTPTRTA